MSSHCLAMQSLDHINTKHKSRRLNLFTKVETKQYWGPQGFWGSGENDYLFSGI